MKPVASSQVVSDGTDGSQASSPSSIGGAANTVTASATPAGQSLSCCMRNVLEAYVSSPQHRPSSQAMPGSARRHLQGQERHSASALNTASMICSRAVKKPHDAMDPLSACIAVGMYSSHQACS